MSVHVHVYLFCITNFITSLLHSCLSENLLKLYEKKLRQNRGTQKYLIHEKAHGKEPSNEVKMFFCIFISKKQQSTKRFLLSGEILYTSKFQNDIALESLTIAPIK